MRLIRFRFTMRRLMILVAAIAILLWGGQMAFRSHRALQLARKYQAQSALFRQNEQHDLKKVRDSEQDVSKTETTLALAEREKEEARKYLTSYISLSREILRTKLWLLDYYRKDADRSSTLRSYYEFLEAKYRRAAARPWLPVEPDPPYPD